MHPLMGLLKWAERNERHLGAVLFVFGFVTDLFTFAFLSVAIVNLAFIGYLALALISTLGSHLFSGARAHPSLWRRTLAVAFPLAAQYAIGSLLSGCLIFYTKSAAVIVSWPFLLLLALVFIGNEYFRTYYKHLAFRVVLLFFALYAYAIFALPLALNRLGPTVFIASTAISVVAFALCLYLLSRMRREGFRRSLRYAIPGAALVVVLMSGSYFLGLIPPIPLTLPSAGVYYGVRHENGQYIVSLESDRAWWDIRPQTMKHAPGAPLFAFTSVSAPFAFSASVVHVWEHYDSTTHAWTRRARIQFPITGGRDGGFRGWSEIANPQAGKWRITIETPSGQVIGRLYFAVEDVDTAPLLKEEVR